MIELRPGQRIYDRDLGIGAVPHVVSRPGWWRSRLAGVVEHLSWPRNRRAALRDSRLSGANGARMPTLGLRYAACAGVEAGKPVVEIAIRRSIRNWRDPEHRGTQARRGRRTRRRHRDGHVVDDRDRAGRNGVLDPAQPHRPHLLALGAPGRRAQLAGTAHRHGRAPGDVDRAGHGPGRPGDRDRRAGPPPRPAASWPAWRSG